MIVVVVVVLVVVVTVVRHAEACPDCARKFVKKCSNMAKSARIVREFLKKCLKFRNSARKLLVVINYFPADVHKYS